MRSIRTLCITPEVIDWLTNTRHPRILHIFEDVCNLVNEETRVVSIVTTRIGKGPFNLVVDKQGSFSESLRIESPVSIRGTRLTIGDLTFSAADAQCWSPYPDWQSLHNNQLNIARQCTALRIPNSQIQDTLRANLAFAFSNGNISAAQTIASRLAGLGIGLTPAGDDFLLGALYAIMILHPQEKAKCFVNEIVNSTARLTTTLSAAWLRAAARGEAGIAWHEFFSALVHANSLQVQFTMNKILATGATSGAEALAGFISTCIAYAESDTRLCRF